MALGGHEGALARLGVAGEVVPPQAGHQCHHHERGAGQPPVDRDLVAAGADRHHGLAEGDDDDQAVALDEVLRMHGETGDAREVRAEVVDRDGGDP